MDITVAKVVVWLIVGGLAGSFTGMLVKRSKEGFGRWTNFGIGLAGAIIGGILFNVLKIDLGLLGEVKISVEELLAAFIGSLIFLVIVWAVRKWLAAREARMQENPRGHRGTPTA